MEVRAARDLVLHALLDDGAAERLPLRVVARADRREVLDVEERAAVDDRNDVVDVERRGAVAAEEAADGAATPITLQGALANEPPSEGRVDRGNGGHQ